MSTSGSPYTFLFLSALVAGSFYRIASNRMMSWRNRKKLKNLIALINDSPPPKKIFMSGNSICRNYPRNAINAALFFKKTQAIHSFAERIEEDILTYSDIEIIKKFIYIQLLVHELYMDAEEYKSFVTAVYTKQAGSPASKTSYKFQKLLMTYQKLMTTCRDQYKEIGYVDK